MITDFIQKNLKNSIKHTPTKLGSKETITKEYQQLEFFRYISKNIHLLPNTKYSIKPAPTKLSAKYNQR